MGESSLPNETLIALTSEIVSAHLSNNPLACMDVASLIESVFRTLSRLGARAEQEPVPEKPKPAISARSSVKPDAVICMDCGMNLKILKRHLWSCHGMTVEQYRAKWELASNHPIVAPSYAEKRRVIAKGMGLGQNIGMAGKRGTARLRTY